MTAINPTDATAILMIDCPDLKGIVAATANFLYRYGANILHAEHRFFAMATRRWSLIELALRIIHD